MDKQSVVTSLIPIMEDSGTQKTWANSHGVQMYNLQMTLQNGDKGTYSSERPEGSVSVGDEVTYNLEVKGKWTNIRKVKKVDPNYNQGTSSGAPQKSYRSGGADIVKSEKIKAASMSLAWAKDLVVAGKVDVKQLLPTATKLMLHVHEKIDEINQ